MLQRARTKKLIDTHRASDGPIHGLVVGNYSDARDNVHRLINCIAKRSVSRQVSPKTSQS